MLVRNRFTNDTRVEQEARTLAGAGHAVTVVADAGPGLPERETRDGFDVVRVRRGGPNVPGLRFVAHELRLARRLAALRPDILHAHDSNALVPVALAARRRRVPFVYDAHDLWLGRPRRERSRLYFALGNAWYSLVERLLVPRAAAVLTVSEPIARHLERRYRISDVTLVPNYPAPELASARPRARCGRSPAARRSTRIGRSCSTSVASWAAAGSRSWCAPWSSVPDAQLVLLGDGVLGEPLRRQAIDSASATGCTSWIRCRRATSSRSPHRPTSGSSPIMQPCLNYRYSLPNKLFQYMAAGMPVVAVAFPQVRDVVEGTDAGLVIDTSRPTAIAAAIRGSWRTRHARAMGERGRAAVARGSTGDLRDGAAAASADDARCRVDASGPPPREFAPRSRRHACDNAPHSTPLEARPA